MDKLYKWGANPNYVGVTDDKNAMTYRWKNVETTAEQFFEFVSVDGVSFSCWLTNGHRKNENFVCTDIIGVDVDDGMRIEDLQNDPLYEAYGGGYYTTRKHTDEAHRFRIFFFLEETIDHPQRMKYLLTELIDYYGADDACKDVSRFFFGTVDAPRREFRPDKILPKEIVDGLIDDRIKKEQALITASYQPPQNTGPYGRSTLYTKAGSFDWDKSDLPSFVPEGQRHTVAASAIGKMIAYGYDAHTTRQEMYKEFANRCPRFDAETRKDIDRIIKDFY